MPDALSIVNLGLGKIAASRVASIAPPRSPLERHCAAGYEHWRDNELELRTWTFSLKYQELTQEGPALGSGSVLAVPKDGRRFVYPLPNDCLRPLRDSDTEWEQRGDKLYSAHETLALAYVSRADEAQFPASFVEVLACRVAVECVEFATQSTQKDETASAKYTKAVREAGRLNAFKVGFENPTTPDEHDEWVSARMGGI